MRSVTQVISPAGAAGNAGGSVEIGVGPACVLRGVFIDYDPTMPATTDVTLTNLGRTVVTATNTNTDKLHRPTEAGEDATGAPVTTLFQPIVHGSILVTVAQGNAVANGVTVTVFLDDHGV